MLGIRTEPVERELLNILRRGVASGRLVCPISVSTFLELMKQRDLSTRIGTAQIIDELSLGTAMVPPQVVLGTEVCSFLLRARGNVDLYPMQELIWTKVAYVFGNLYPSPAQLSRADWSALQEAFFDYLWDSSLVDMLKTMGDSVPHPERFVNLTQEINKKNVQYKDELVSFAETYDIELRGVIEIAGRSAADIIHRLAEKEVGHRLSLAPEEYNECAKKCCNFLYCAFNKAGTKDTLRSLHIGASIHAAVRWDKGRKFKQNDYYDFDHAIAALGYCDAFLTERSLHHLVTQPQTNLQQLNGCRVFSDFQAAFDHLRQISSSD